MQESNELPACPVETTLMLIGDKWKVLILRDLMPGTKRFGELKKSIRHVSQKVLTAQLRDMESKGLVNRKVYAEVPPKVEYSLTDLGKSLKPVLDAMWSWGEGYKEKFSSWGKGTGWPVPVPHYHLETILSLLNGFSEVKGLLNLWFAFDVSNVPVSSGQYVAQILPPQVFHQMVVIENDIIKAVSFRCHQKRGGSAVSTKQISVAFFQGEETVHGSTELTAHVPVIERGSQHNHITFLYGGIDLIHIILLDAGTFLAAVTAEASAASVDIHPV